MKEEEYEGGGGGGGLPLQLLEEEVCLLQTENGNHILGKPGADNTFLIRN